MKKSANAEAEWLACQHAGTLARLHPSPRPPMRKWRLFGVACCRRVADWFIHPGQQALLSWAERYAEGLATATELDTARTADQVSPWLSAAAIADITVDVILSHPLDGINTKRLKTDDDLKAAAAATALQVVAQAVWSGYSHYLPYERQVEEVAAAVVLCHHLTMGETAVNAERLALADLFRDLFGNPFRPVRFLPKWKAPAVISIAKELDACAGFFDMNKLATALEAAGCNDEQVLSHCRHPGPHARGSWVLDRLLGKK